ncbi:MAG: NF038130 family PEP-CTERM protein [Oscillatoria sp. Prado101]|jgi:hypothetical protein|nr:NF038130 family PEP-CTERM protein [Oscillatoria sp. Prado101]
MAGLVKKLLVGATLAAGVTALATAPAKAGSLTGASITGVNGTDYYLYDANATNTYRNDAASLSTILTGNSSSPTGNVELFANSETLTNAQFATYNKVTTLSGLLGGRSITLSSLTAADWANNVGGGLTLAQKWFNDALTNNGLGSLIGTTTGNNAYSAFLANNGRQRFSDPNISYVNQNDTTGQISIGLAGHFNAKSLLLPVVPSSLQPLLAGKTIQASEIVKVSYDGGPAQYLYNFSATNSGLVEAGDRISHSGNYELLLAGIPPEKVPEPSAMLGLMAVGGFLAAKRKMKNA